MRKLNPWLGTGLVITASAAVLAACRGPSDPMSGGAKSVCVDTLS
jgi:hypothetical protein